MSKYVNKVDFRNATFSTFFALFFIAVTVQSFYVSDSLVEKGLTSSSPLLVSQAVIQVCFVVISLVFVAFATMFWGEVLDD